MRKVSAEELKEICLNHIKWLKNEEGGEKANLSDSDLRGSNLRDSDLRGSDLRSSNLRGSNLRGSDLSGSKNSQLAQAVTYIVPEGSIIGWKKIKCTTGTAIAKLRIPEESKRSNATGRKCRAEWAIVLEVIGAENGWASRSSNFLYEVGKEVRPDKWDDNRWDECSNGIHFFITKEEAEAYDL